MTALAATGRSAVDRAMTRLAARLGCSEGQAYTIVIGIVFGLAVSAIGIPPTLRDRPAAQAATSAPPREDASAGALGLDRAGPTNDAGAVPFAVEGATVNPITPPSPQPFDGVAPAGAAAPPAETVFDPDPPFGTATRLTAVGEHGEPEGIASLPGGGVAVGVSTGHTPSKVLVLTASGAVGAIHEMAGQTPGARRITGLARLGDAVVVLDTAPARVLLLDPTTGHQEVLATLPDLRPCVVPVPQPACQPNPVDLPPLPRAVTAAGDDTLLVTDETQSTIWRITKTGAVDVWHQSEDYPVGGLQGITVSDRRVIVAARLSTIGATAADKVYAITMRSDGTAGARTDVATIDGGGRPAAVAAGRSGRIYVALEALDAILVLDRSGREVARLTGSDAARVDGPAGLALAGTSLLVASRSDALAPAPVRNVVAIAVGDTQAET